MHSLMLLVELLQPGEERRIVRVWPAVSALAIVLAFSLLMFWWIGLLAIVADALYLPAVAILGIIVARAELPGVVKLAIITVVPAASIVLLVATAKLLLGLL